MIVAGLLWDIMVLQPARRLEIEHENLRLQQRSVYPLTFAGYFTLEQRTMIPSARTDRLKDRRSECRRALALAPVAR